MAKVMNRSLLFNASEAATLIKTLNEDNLEDMTKFLELCLKEKPEDRPKDGGEIAEEIEDLLESIPEDTLKGPEVKK